MKLDIFGKNWSPWNDFDRVANEMLNLCSPSTQNRVRSANWHVITTDSGWNIEVELPGLTKEDLNIEIDSDMLKIEELDEENKFSALKFKIPKDSIKDNISAKMENGILNVSIPKEEINSDKRSINID